MNSYIIAAIGDWNKSIFEQEAPVLREGSWHLVTTPEELEKQILESSPRFIFFVHWRWIVPEKIFGKYECVCFHMTDLPYGRGGSPLQNLILSGHRNTKLSALKMTSEIDAGPVYLKKELNLNGPAWKIYERASLLSWQMIKQLINVEIEPRKQLGKATYFKRRRPEESKLPEDISVEETYDFIRMLDAPGYPKAFLRHGNRLFEFDKASLDSGELTARVRMVKDERN